MFAIGGLIMVLDVIERMKELLFEEDGLSMTIRFERSVDVEKLEEFKICIQKLGDYYREKDVISGAKYFVDIYPQLIDLAEEMRSDGLLQDAAEVLELAAELKKSINDCLEINSLTPRLIENDLIKKILYLTIEENGLIPKLERGLGLDKNQCDEVLSLLGQFSAEWSKKNNGEMPKIIAKIMTELCRIITYYYFYKNKLGKEREADFIAQQYFDIHEKVVDCL
jgi:hypothetical protein